MDHVCISTGERHVDAVEEQMPEVAPEHIFAEPAPRDSTAAIALATAVLARRHGNDIVVGSFAADHVIRGKVAFVDAVRQAVATARAGYVTTIGIAASRPSTAFGYIHDGEYRWNAGMFVMRADVLLDHLHRVKPQLARAIDAIADAVIEDDRDLARAQAEAHERGENVRETVNPDDFHAHRDEAMRK